MSFQVEQWLKAYLSILIELSAVNKDHTEINIRIVRIIFLLSEKFIHNKNGKDQTNKARPKSQKANHRLLGKT